MDDPWVIVVVGCSPGRTAQSVAPAHSSILAVARRRRLRSQSRFCRSLIEGRFLVRSKKSSMTSFICVKAEDTRGWRGVINIKVPRQPAEPKA